MDGQAWGGMDNQRVFRASSAPPPSKITLIVAEIAVPFTISLRSFPKVAIKFGFRAVCPAAARIARYRGGASGSRAEMG